MLNREGIYWLADDLVANAQWYDQRTYGDLTGCGTVCCMAGFCLIRKVGLREFTRRLLWCGFGNEAVQAGYEQLGIRGPSTLFGYPSCWPFDLHQDYDHATSQKERVIVALKALQRLKDDGSLDRDPNAVHTRLPHLDLLLEPEEEEEEEPVAV